MFLNEDFLKLWEKLNKLNENTTEEAKITAVLKSAFGSETTCEGSSYITSDGTFLNMPDTHHDVLPVLIKAGIISAEDIYDPDNFDNQDDFNNFVLDNFDDDSINGYDFEIFFTRSDINYIRCNNGLMGSDCCYIELPESRPTEDQLRSLEQWLDEQVFTNPELEQIELGSQFTKVYKQYYLSDYTSDDLIKRIKRYYSSGRLYEKVNK